MGTGLVCQRSDELPVRLDENLLEVVIRRYENRSTIMTSNRPLEDWGKLRSDVPTAEAILDRFLHHAISISITSEATGSKTPRPAPRETKKAKTHLEHSTTGATS